MPGITSTRNTKPRNQKQQKTPKPIPETDPMDSKSTISSVLLTPFSPTTKKKNKFTSFRGLGCRATSPQVSVPDTIKTSADWESKKVKNNKKKRKKNKTLNLNFVGGEGNNFSTQNSCCNNSSCFAAPDDVWCGLTADAASVDCVVSTRPLSGRARLHITPREIVMLQNSLMGGRTEGLDRYRSWRLNVDNMSYEELLELGDRIGYVSTGLKEQEITQMCQENQALLFEYFIAFAH